MLKVFSFVIKIQEWHKRRNVQSLIVCLEYVSRNARQRSHITNLRRCFVMFHSK
jgi:ssRNA-specific RNase YbeY (16S rRNA maturation enzyme)